LTWTILRSAPCREFRARDELHRLGLSAYVPVEFDVSRFGRGRETIRKSPIIRGYVFAAVPDSHWPTVAAVRDIKGAIMFNGRPARLAQREVDAIELLSRPVERHRGVRWRPGDSVAIRRGAFAALEGVVRRIERGKIITEIHMLGKLCEVPVSADHLEAA